MAARPELLLAGAFGIVVLITLGVLKLASEIAEGETLAGDRAVLLWLRTTVRDLHCEDPVRRIMLDITALGSGTTLTLVVILACGSLISLKRYGTAAILALQIVAGTRLISFAKVFFSRARPDVVPHFTSFSNASFPSGHAANSAIVYLSVAVLLATAAQSRAERIFILAAAMVLTVAIGISRLYLGVHWPSDVLAGWAIGAGWALSVGLVVRWLGHRGARHRA